jgi:hypothetical protein
MKSTYVKTILHTILDRRLYGRTFCLNCLPFLAFGISFQSAIIFALNRQMLALYLPTAIGVVLFSALGAKNTAREFYCIGYYLGLLFLFASVLAETLTFLIQVQNSLFGTFQIVAVFSISTVAFVISTVHIAVWGQRVSLRVSAGLTDDFFRKKKKKWENELDEFPNAKGILEAMDGGRFIANLFDRGSFNLVVLWSCNVMEEIIDAIADSIILVNPEKTELFKTKDGRRLNYPRQLKNFGWILSAGKDLNNDSLNEDRLWNALRNNIAHHNHKPTFPETYGALTILTSFMDTTPKTLQTWKPPQQPS